MDRRKFLGATVSVTAFSGCTRFQDNSDTRATSSLEIEEEFCEEREASVSITDHTAGKIEYKGTIQGVKEGYGMSPTIFGSSKEKELVCKILCFEGSGPPSVSCSGSVAYSGTIDYSNIEVNGVFFVHMVDGEQGLGRTIATETS